MFVDKKTKTTYQLHADPGGNIPAWLANQTVVDMPYATMERLKNLVE